MTALFGGSFDPVHLGHVNAVRSLIDSELEIDRVIIMPAYVNPFKQHDDRSRRADSRQRLEMCRIAFSQLPMCEISDHEISKKDVSYTVLTLEHLHRLYPDDSFILTVGSDSLESLPRWYRFEDIIKLARIAAVSRCDEDCAKIEAYRKNIENAGGTVHIINTEPFDISSTEIRKKILNNQEISCYVDQNVVKYIMTEKIYR